MKTKKITITLIMLLSLCTACTAFTPEPTSTSAPTVTNTLPPTATATLAPTATSQSVHQTEIAAQEIFQTQTADFADWMYNQAILGYGASPERIQMPQQDQVQSTIYYFVSGNVYVVGFTEAYSRPTNLRAGGENHSQLIAGNFYYQVELEFSSECGPTPLGVFIREANRKYTLFAIRCTGEFSLTKVDKDSDEDIYNWQPTDLIDSDTNILEVVAYRDLVRAYINGILVAELTGIQEAGQLGVHMGPPIDGGAAMFRFLSYTLKNFTNSDT